LMAFWTNSGSKLNADIFGHYLIIPIDQLKPIK
jgi:hypothetical protein